MTNLSAVTNNNSNRRDLYSRITSQIIADLEACVRPWSRPWNAEHGAGRISRPIRHNGVPYQGINILVLWSTGHARGHFSPIWMTYKQARQLGGYVRRGERGEQVVYADKLVKTEENQNGEEVQQTIPFLKSYTVFNAEQINGLPDQYYQYESNPLKLIDRIDSADKYFAAIGAEINHGGNQAYYSLDQDRIQMPPYESFKDVQSYYSTLAHEHMHWTRHPSRLDRDLGRKQWGDEGYAREELVAELGSAFLCADLGLIPEIMRGDHAAYISSWIQVLQQDNKAIFQTAAYAQKAVDYLHELHALETAVASCG